MQRTLFLCLCLASALAGAAEPVLRPSAGLLFRNPELLQPGRCVEYREGGDGWLLTAPTYFLRGKMLSAEVQTRTLAACPKIPGKMPSQYSREEFNQVARAYPCLPAGEAGGARQLGLVRLTVDDWETPHARAAANAGRLYRGSYIDQPLRRGLEIEIEADLLHVCAP